MHGTVADFPQQSTGSPEQSCKFGTIVHVLADGKPVVWLSQKLDCTEREARYLIRGERRVTAACVQLVVNEMLRPDARAYHHHPATGPADPR